jgi:hypothetical protein
MRPRLKAEKNKMGWSRFRWLQPSRYFPQGTDSNALIALVIILVVDAGGLGGKRKPKDRGKCADRDVASGMVAAMFAPSAVLCPRAAALVPAMAALAALDVTAAMAAAPVASLSDTGARQQRANCDGRNGNTIHERFQRHDVFLPTPGGQRLLREKRFLAA